MQPSLTRIAAASAAVLGSLLMAACGGGGETADTTPQVKFTSVKVFGDSLQDNGTFGFKFTIQSANNLIYVERIAANYGLTLCPYYTATGTTSFVPNTAKTGCTNYAIGGGRITYTSVLPANPLNIGMQMAAYAATNSYAATDLAIIDGGGNDAADLVGAYLAIRPGNAASAASYAALLGTLLTPTQINTALAGGATTTGAIGADYMKALADKFYNAIKANVLDKGATHVVVINMPDITLTPRFLAVLDGVALASGGGTAGKAVRDQVQALARSWLAAYNAQLASRLGSDDRVALVDIYQAVNDQAAAPAQYGLTNITTPACPPTGVDAFNLPTYSLNTCTDTGLSAAPPAGVTGADWWKSYGYSDSFHPTLYGHQLVQQLIGKSLATKGWL